MEACCTCATLLSQAPQYAPGTEKPYPHDKSLDCCGRRICGKCIHDNARFAFYCPYCQISSEQSSSSLPLHGLKEPPSYETSTDNKPDAAPPPPYSSSASAPSPDQIDNKKASQFPECEDVLHFLDHEHDTVASLSLRYGVPTQVLRRTNNLTSDNLLLARRTILIPSSHYTGGVSLSPRPVEGEEEELRRSKIRRWMVGCRVADYDEAVMYLEREGWDLAAAMEAWSEDERWERENPMAKSAGKRTFGSAVPSRQRTRNRPM